MSSSILRSAARLLHSSAPATAQLSATRRAAEAVAAASATRIHQSQVPAAAGFPQVAAHSTAPLVVPSPAHGASSVSPAARVEQPSVEGPGPQAVTKFAETD